MISGCESSGQKIVKPQPDLHAFASLLFKKPVPFVSVCGQNLLLESGEVWIRRLNLCGKGDDSVWHGKILPVAHTALEMRNAAPQRSAGFRPNPLDGA